MGSTGPRYIAVKAMRSRNQTNAPPHTAIARYFHIRSVALPIASEPEPPYKFLTASQQARLSLLRTWFVLRPSLSPVRFAMGISPIQLAKNRERRGKRNVSGAMEPD